METEGSLPFWQEQPLDPILSNVQTVHILALYFYI